MTGSTGHRWSCLAPAAETTGDGPRRGLRVAASLGAGYAGGLIRALDQPWVERRVIAVLVLDHRWADRASGKLEQLTRSAEGRYLACAAVGAPAEAPGLPARTELVVQGGAAGPLPVRPAVDDLPVDDNDHAEVAR